MPPFYNSTLRRRISRPSLSKVSWAPVVGVLVQVVVLVVGARQVRLPAGSYLAV
jgi:hypothetical protein